MRFIVLSILIATILTLFACSTEEKRGSNTNKPVSRSAVPVTSNPSLETLDQRLSYIIGENIAHQFKKDYITLDSNAFVLAIDNIQAGNKSLLSEELKYSTIIEAKKRSKKQKKAESATLSIKNKIEGDAYILSNGKKEGVITTNSGLQYKQITAGNGDVPSIKDTVTVHYKGTLIDGTVFDSSYNRGEPATFHLEEVIAGWTEALQLMNVGDKFQLVTPSNLAYGSSGTGSIIGPDSTLLFEIELLKIVKTVDKEKKS